MIRLFVIDNDPLVIEGCHYRVHPARDGVRITGSALNVNEAIHKAGSGDFDIFILDLHIPESEPCNNVKILKSRSPRETDCHLYM